MTCDSRRGSSWNEGSTGTAGRTTQTPPRNYWPDHDQAPVTNFINERHRVAVMWKL